MPAYQKYMQAHSVDPIKHTVDGWEFWKAGHWTVYVHRMCGSNIAESSSPIQCLFCGRAPSPQVALMMRCM